MLFRSDFAQAGVQQVAQRVTHDGNSPNQKKKFQLVDVIIFSSLDKMTDANFPGGNLTFCLGDAQSIRFFAGGIFVVAETDYALFDWNFVFRRDHKARNMLSEITFTF